MNQIVINDSPVKRGNFTLSPVSPTVQKGEIFAILGHMGSDKTIFLEAISGLSPRDTGSILFDGIGIQDILPGQRKLGLVYQGYGLFPHMKVKENIFYGLKIHRYLKEEQDSHVQELIETLPISHMGDQYPGTLSGGENRRTALTKAPASAPQVFLLNEPSSALDSATRQPLYQGLRRIHRYFGCAIIFVTHDFLEVQTLAGYAIVLLEGELKTVTDTSESMNGYFSAEVEGFLERNQTITAPECQRERGIIQ